MDSDLIIGFVTLAGSVAASYMKTHTEVTRLRAEVEQIKNRERDVSEILKETNAAIRRIEHALVRAGYIEPE